MRGDTFYKLVHDIIQRQKEFDLEEALSHNPESFSSMEKMADAHKGVGSPPSYINHQIGV